MDFKVAGTEQVITALQLDTKLDGIPASVLAAALKQAHGARMTILGVMREAISAPGEMSLYAPRIITLKVPVDKIGDAIGPKGKMINSFQDHTEVEIREIDDRGKLSLVPVEVLEREAAGEDLSGGEPSGEREQRDRGDRPHRDRGDRDGGDRSRTRHRSRERNS